MRNIADKSLPVPVKFSAGAPTGSRYRWLLTNFAPCSAVNLRRAPPALAVAIRRIARSPRTPACWAHASSAQSQWQSRRRSSLRAFDHDLPRATEFGAHLPDEMQEVRCCSASGAPAVGALLRLTSHATSLGERGAKPGALTHFCHGHWPGTPPARPGGRSVLKMVRISFTLGMGARSACSPTAERLRSYAATAQPRPVSILWASPRAAAATLAGSALRHRQQARSVPPAALAA